MKNIALISMLPAAAFCSAARRREVNPAGVREPTSPTSAEPVPSLSRGSRRPDARTGRARARRLVLLPVLALLLGALGLFAAAPAQAQSHIWSATLTVSKDGIYYGCETAATQEPCSSALTDDDFEYNGRTYRISRLSYISSTNRFQMSTDPTPRAKLAGLVLHLGNTRLTLGDFGAEGRYQWTGVNPQWTDNQQVTVSLVVPSLGRAGSMSVDGFHPMGPGRMKIAEGTSITYGIVIHQPPTLDLTITPRHHNVRPDGSDYPNVDNSLLTIHNAVTWKAAPHPNYLSGDWQQAKSVGLTAVDDNECKSPPGTRYWIRHHGSGGGPDWGGWDRQDRHHGLVISIEIIDDDCKYLAASPGQVSPEEGASATYTVRLKTPLEDAAYISPRISVPGDSDPGAITVSPERIRVEAGDTSPKTFTVSAGRDANSRNEVLVVDHSVDSPEVPADYLGGRVTVIVQDEQNAARTHERDALSVTGLALTAGSGAVALSPAFSTDVLSYRAEVPAGTAGVTLAPHWSGGASVFAGSRRGGTTFTRPSRVRPSGTAVDLALAPDGGATELWVMASGGSGGMTTYRIEVTEAQTQAQAPEEQTTPEEEAQTVAVEFGNVPPEHDGRTAFALDVQSGSKPAPEAFTVTAGKVTGVEPLDPVLWRVRVMPKSWKDVTVALGEASATVRGPARIRVADARAKEGKDASLDFAVTLHRAAAHEVSVDYATADGTAAAGADYTAASGTLTFAPGETSHTVSVALLDDAIDEGKETFKLTLSNPRGAFLRAMHREAKGVIRNDDPMPGAWLSRFGRTAAGHVAGAIDGRLSGGAAGVVLGGHSLTGGKAEREAIESRLAEALLKEREARLGRGEEAPVSSVREVSMSELLLASSFHMASAGGGDAPGGRWSLWGRGARSSFEGAGGDLSLDGDVTTATVGFDYERSRWLVGVALSRSSGDGSYKMGGACDTGCAGEVESTLTGVWPYARYRVSGSFSLWGVVGLGSGGMTLTPGGAESMDADLDMGVAAGGARGVLLPARAPGGFELALRADVLVTDTRSDAAAGLAETEAGTSRVRLALEGSRSYKMGDAVLTPSVEIGFRNDSGDAETGGGVEAGGGLRWSSGALTAEVRARGLLSHNEGGYEEWGVSASVGYAPGSDGRGLSLRAGSSWGAAAGGVERLWSRAGGSFGGGAFDPVAGLDAEAGWGLDAWGGLLTPYTGFTLTGSGETYRAGGRFRLAESLTMSLEGDLRERDGGASVHGVALRGSMRW